MSDREKFINEISAYIEDTTVILSEEAERFFTEFKSRSVSKVEIGNDTGAIKFTENGKKIYDYMLSAVQESGAENRFTSKSIAEALFIAPRSVSGAMRKLVTDGFVEKIEMSGKTYIYGVVTP